MTGIYDLKPAPYKLKLSDRSTKAEVLDKSGKVVGSITCSESIYNAYSAHDAILLRTRSSSGENGIARIYRYGIVDSEINIVADRVDGIYDLTIDQKYMICREKPLKAPVNGPNHSKLRNPVKIILLDASKSFKPVFSTGEYSGDYAISPDGSRIAYMELVKDEYGDMGNFSLKAADIHRNKVRNIITNRRMPGYMWCGNDALAVTTYDKFNIPTLNRFALDTGKMTRMVTDRDAAIIEPVRYDPKSGEIYYNTYPTNTKNPGDAITWVFGTGGKPRKSAPLKNGISPGMMPGPGVSGMPGMPPPSSLK